MREFGELLARGQFAVDQQVCDFEEIALLGELLDRNAAMKQHTLVPVDESDLAFAGRGRHETGIEGEHPVIFGKTRDIEHIRPKRAALDVGRGLLSRRQIRQLKFLLGHVLIPDSEAAATSAGYFLQMQIGRADLHDPAAESSAEAAQMNA
jgi:hypothetical protein